MMTIKHVSMSSSLVFCREATVIGFHILHSFLFSAFLFSSAYDDSFRNSFSIPNRFLPLGLFPFFKGLGGVVGLMLPLALVAAVRVPYTTSPCSDLGQVGNLSLSVA